MVALSVLDVSPIIEGGTVQDSLRNSLDLARHAEKWGYTRFWLAEHHNSPSIASSATSVVIGHVAAGTTSIRVGSGGIMLPNHASLAIAEQFGTLEALYPGRIDLGLGRAPGTDQRTAAALRGDSGRDGQFFPEQLAELRAYFAGRMPIRAIPGEGMTLPIWLLGSSDYSARLAAELGLPFGFAGHFSPQQLLPALELYHRNFQPSRTLAEPYALVAINVIAAETDREAERLATSGQQLFLSFIRNRPGPLPAPVDSMEGIWTEREKLALQQNLGGSIVGGPDTVREKLQRLLHDTKANEIMAVAHIYDHAARLRSYEITAEIGHKLSR
ncbi:LLM class flavin-dependent oxidoreductase [Paenibacillus ginsengarvi]|uniref:LLM class flavin-dependent oxidoreductase n=1 Tax=Paenibacillus ginsengarvi TaxID=400777 RepID=A0A3B0AYY0_9BACL|nr:LLM class flavin-dependent oxidoreductase [Paenibacillus ginsengarvi]RKN65461.1 LLM class flavin-dependent oxidoreductase [Paenibacillus ginsengarvi]